MVEVVVLVPRCFLTVVVLFEHRLLLPFGFPSGQQIFGFTFGQGLCVIVVRPKLFRPQVGRLLPSLLLRKALGLLALPLALEKKSYSVQRKRNQICTEIVFAESFVTCAHFLRTESSLAPLLPFPRARERDGNAQTEQACSRLTVSPIFGRDMT